MASLPIEQVGTTVDGKRVISGIFKMFSSNGTPLDVIFSWCVDNDMVPSWLHFYDEAILDGWSEETILRRLNDNLTDVYGPEYKSIVIDRLRLYRDYIDQRANFKITDLRKEETNE